MGTIKGQNLRIKLNNKAVAFSTSCTVHVAASLEESSTKDTTGDWQDQESVSKNWDISVDALYSVETDASGINGLDAFDLVGQTVTVVFEQTTGTKNRESVAGSVTRTGTAIVNDISLNAANRQNASYTLQATGKGALTSSAAASDSSF